MQPQIVFVHGAWMTPLCWENFLPTFKSTGYECITPAWPYKDGSIEQQRAKPKPELALLGIQEIVDHYAEIIKKLPEPPILIGHSFGGLFVQMLLDRGLGRCGIAIDPAPPKGVFSLYPSAVYGLRLPITTPFGWKKVLRWPFEHFRYAFVHTLAPELQKAAYERYVVPESGRLFWQAATAPLNNSAYVNFNNQKRAPLLIIAGQKDRIVPAVMNYRNYKKYKNSSARTDFKEFPNRVHWIIAEPGYEEVAKYCLDWQKIFNTDKSSSV